MIGAPHVTIADSVTRAITTLTAAGIAATDARQDAAVLARHQLRWDLAHWLGHQRDDAPGGFEPAFMRLIARRAAHEPVAYITGEREFYGRSFAVSPAVLIPRPETELIVEEAVGIIAASGNRAPTIIDVGTGSGCLAITLACECPGARVIATDISPSALEVAMRNAVRLEAPQAIDFRQGAYFADVTDVADLIVSNPPYVPDGDRVWMAPEVADREPAIALFSGRNGLDCIIELIARAPQHLRSRGHLIIEFGHGQAEGVRQLVERSAQLTLIGIRPDLQSIPRVAVIARA